MRTVEDVLVRARDQVVRQTHVENRRRKVEGLADLALRGLNGYVARLAERYMFDAPFRAARECVSIPVQNSPLC